MALQLALGAMLLSPSQLLAQRPELVWQLDIEQVPENCFADQPSQCKLKLTGPAAQIVRVNWQLKFAQRTWQRGSLRVNTQAALPVDVEFEFKSPPLAAGVITLGKLELQVVDERDKLLKEQQLSLWVFHDNPFDTEFGWLKQIPLQLVETDEQLRDRLKALGLTVKDESVPKQNSILIVGQSAVWDSVTSQRIDRALKDGRPVLCLAAAAGRLRISHRDTGMEPSDLLETHAVSMEYAKQLDARLSSKQLSALARFRISAELDNQLTLSIQPNQPGWVFCETMFHGQSLVHDQLPASIPVQKQLARPRLIVCTADLMGRWHEVPTARYLFASMLARLCQEP